MPCPDCGASVARAEADEHECERDRWLDYQLFLRREEVERFGDDLSAWLDSPEGRFQVWFVERNREDGTSEED